jgi:DNA polymerase III delta subunit
MIRFLTGENDFELTKKVAQLQTDFDGRAERYDAADLSAEALADIFAGQTLFAIKRLIIIDQPSANSELWQNLPAWNDRLSDETHLVLVDTKPDKRTASYKWLQKHADVHTFTAWTPRDQRLAHAWLLTHAKEKSVKLTARQTDKILERAGLNQWALAHAVDKLSLASELTDQLIDDVIPAKPSENVFALLETALNGQSGRVLEMTASLKQTEDAYRVFGLLTSQVLQLGLLAYSGPNVRTVANDTKLNSYMLERLAPYAARMNRQTVQTMIHRFAESDRRLKSSDADPWVVVETALLDVARL